MKKIILLLMTLSFIVTAQTNKSFPINGRWINADKDEIFNITSIGNEYVGHLVWLKHAHDKNGMSIKDKNNPNKILRNRNVLFSQIIFGLRYEDGQWKNGIIYSFNKGGTINFEVVSITENKLTIKISKLFFSKQISYMRVQ